MCFMPTKAQMYAQMAEEAALQVTGSRENWTTFLTTAARLYKYPYHEQLMIHKQRPEATACAEYDFWNERMGRYVKRGSKGIALVVYDGNQPRLRYVFDVADTGGRRNSRPVKLWTMEDEYRKPVMEALEKSYGVSAADNSLETQLEEIARQLAAEYWNDFGKNIIDIVEDSFLMEYDEYNIGASFRNAATISITYALYSRCCGNPDDYFEHEDFLDIFDFNTRQTANYLGTAVSELSSQVFREIEVTIRNYERMKQAERSQDNERDHLQTGWRLPDSQHRTDTHGEQASGQVRENASGLSERTQSHAPERPDSQREAVSAPVGDRRNGTSQSGAANDRVAGAESRTGQSDSADGVGTAHEQPESTGGGDRGVGAGEQLTLNLFLSEAEQISLIDEAESQKLSAFSFSNEQIDQMLIAGGNEPNLRMMVALEYMKGKSTEEIAKRLPELYRGGNGFKLDGAEVSVWFDEQCIHIARGKTAHFAPSRQVVSWQEAAERIGKLLDSGEYATNVELVEGPGYERTKVAESLWYLVHDLSENGRELGCLASLQELGGGGFPDETKTLADKLEDSEFRSVLMAEYQRFLETYRDDRSILRFHYHKLERLEQQLEELSLPLREYHTDMAMAPVVRQFITDDEINEALSGGSGFSGGKARIYAYWQSGHSAQDKANFLKNEYGTGGRSNALSGFPGSSEDHDAKGIRYAKAGCDKVQLTWAQVASRIDALMKQGHYLTEQEQAEYDQIQEEKTLEELEQHSEDDSAFVQQVMQDTEAIDSGEETYERFSVTETEGGYAVWDDIRDEIYVDEHGVSEEFTSEWQANDYLQKVKKAVSEKESAEWLYVEQSKLSAEVEADVLTNEEFAAKHLIPGQTVVEIDDRTFRVESVDLSIDKVELRDVTFANAVGFPIFRMEHLGTIRRLLEQEMEKSPEEAMDEHPISVEINGRWQTFPNVKEAERAMHREDNQPQNYVITDDNLGEGGAKLKYIRNVAAIRTLFALEKENRTPTQEEQDVLANYVGWGGLADAFDPNKPAWAQEYANLKNLLPEREYEAARASTLNAHFTSPTVIRAIYDAVGRMGFETGNILEPSMGVGNFFGMLPPEMRNSQLYGVELDSITGRIAQKLYPKADITVAGFETTNRRDFFDLAVGNVPFGNYKVADKPYDKLGFSIHNYFFAKALDQVRPGGVVAFVTSRYTMDSKNTDARKYIAQRAELLGAIRLPNNAFKANAGTEVVSDIIFLQKRDHPIDIVTDWVHLNTTPDGFTMNSYFVEHTEMVLGELITESTQYGKEDLTVRPREGVELSELLREAVTHIEGTYTPVELTEDVESQEKEQVTIPAHPDVKNFSYTVVDGEVYFRENSVMRLVELNDKAKERVCGMVELRRIVNELMEYQLEDYPDEAIIQKQQELNDAYDAFTAKNGLINNKANEKAFSDDSAYYLLCSLENVDEDGNLKSKADIFTKRTIRPERKVTSVDTPVEALAVSIGERGKVDLPFMAQLMGTEDIQKIVEDLRGVIFRIPEPLFEDSTPRHVTADEYLSGNVREKLRQAQLAVQVSEEYRPNVEALEKAQPKDLDASEIDVRLGATWIDADYIQQFMQETFETLYYLRRNIEVKFSDITAEWRISGKTSPSHNDVAAYMTYGTDRANAYRILEETLNLKDIRIYDTIEDADGKQRRVLNKKQTTLAQQKQQTIKDAFRDWIWKDPRRREALVNQYNELFNSTRPREYNGDHIVFGGMNPDITLREHQKNAIAHVLYGGNTLLAHEVGAGKTFEMVASAMESKRLGLCQKSLFVVPNHLTTQWASEFLRLYPSANILVTTKKDFEPRNRKKFCARIATGDYDAVIIGHSQFEKIPLSAERQERQLREQIDEIEGAIAELKWQRGENFSIKQMEKTRKSLQTRLDKLLANDCKDDVVTFEQLGVDRLFVDESHAFKNLFLYTKMRNVAGLSTSEAQKSSDMFMKCRYLDEITGGRGVIFATGTPVSNSMTELYTVMRYLQYATLQKKNLTNFDCWASTFGETTTAIELAPEGTGYRARTRFAKFFNLPELMNMFKEVADIKTSDQLHLPVPDAKFETVVVEPSEHQQDMVAELSERAAAVHSGVVDPSVDNMLKITSDGRKLGLDQRLMNPLLPDDPDSKLNACVRNVLRIWEEGRADKLTQLLFCDLSTPKNDGTFNVYADIKTKLMAAGVPEKEIAFIHTADTEVKKKELFAKVRTGQVRILLGSTQKMGAGTNCQDRLVALHHLDVGWRPSDMTQRNGRIIRQGNMNKEVQVYQYVTEGTFDAYLYQTLENKQKFISQIMTSKSPVRSCDDVDEQALSYAEIKALCAGNPLIKEKMDLDIEVARLKVLKADHQSQQYRMEDKLLKYFPAEIELEQGYIQGFETDMKTVATHPQIAEGFCGMEVMGKYYTEKADAGEMILAACKEVKSTEPVSVGSYRGFTIELSFDSFRHEFDVVLKGAMSHRVKLGTDARGNITRLDNVLAAVPDRLEKAREQLKNLQNQQEATKATGQAVSPRSRTGSEKCSSGRAGCRTQYGGKASKRAHRGATVGIG